MKGSVLILIPLMCCFASESAFSQRNKKRASSLPSHFQSQKTVQPKQLLGSHFTKKASRKSKRKHLPTSFSTQIKASSELQKLSSPFSSKTTKVTRIDSPDHFLRSSSSKKKSLAPNHFSSKKANKPHSYNEIESHSPKKKKTKKHFVGEKPRLFSKDPNRKKKRLFRKSPKSPFGSKKKQIDKEKTIPRGEMDLFGRGELPKMKDFR